jgi:hypothetical protein
VLGASVPTWDVVNFQPPGLTIAHRLKGCARPAAKSERPAVHRIRGVLGLATLPDEALQREEVSRFECFTRRHLDSGPSSGAMISPPGDTLAYVRWLARQRPVLFHGSHRDDLAVLRIDRESTDSSAFGNQAAVSASDDPVWAMWFALLWRGVGFESTRNGASRLRGTRRRQYWFSVNAGFPDEDLLADGWLYVLPRDGFRQEPAFVGLWYSGQWVSSHPVEPLARLAVAPSDFPFVDRIVRHEPGETTLRTLWRVATAHRR